MVISLKEREQECDYRWREVRGKRSPSESVRRSKNNIRPNQERVIIANVERMRLRSISGETRS